MKANVSQILPYFSLNIPLRSLCCNVNCSNMLLWTTVIQITQIQLSINTHFWVINWKPHIEIVPGRPACIYTIWPTEVESYNSCTAITQFSDSRDTYLTKNHYENYSPKMVPTNPTGSWTNMNHQLVTRSFDVFLDLRPNKRLSKQSWGWWFETPSRPLWRHSNGINIFPAGVMCPITPLGVHY